MSNNNNSEVQGMAVAIAFVGVTFIFAGIIIYVVLAAITLGLSIFSLFALWKPRKFGKNTVTPKLARWFLIRGVIGWFALPLIVSLLADAFDWRIDADWIIHIMIAGYIIGALGGEFVLEALDAQEDETPPDIAVPTAPPTLPRPEPKPFTFASWEDEWPRADAANDDEGTRK